MRKKIKSFLVILLALVGVFSVNATVYAGEVNNHSRKITTIYTTKEERDQIFAEEIAKNQLELDEQSMLRGPQYHYKYDYLPYQYKSIGGYAGNQVSGGYRFPTGGGFWFVDQGGPSASANVSLGFPAPFNFVSVSVNLGVNGNSSGLFVNAPNNTNFFKLYVTKVLEVRPYAVYRSRVGTEEWELYSTNAVSVTYSVTPEARKVK